MRQLQFYFALAGCLGVVAAVAFAQKPPEHSPEQKAKVEEANQLRKTGLAQAGEKKYVECEQTLQKVLQLRREVHGDRHITTASALVDLANVERTLARYDSATSHLEEALDVRIEKLGAGHDKVAEVLETLGLLARIRSDYVAAKGYFERELAIRRKNHGAEHEDAITAATRLSRAQFMVGDFAAGKAFGEEAAATAARVLGKQHKTTLLAVETTGQNLRTLGDYKAAIAKYQDCLTVARALYGENSGHVADLLCEIGSAEREARNYAKSEESLRQAIALRLKLSGQEHLETINAQSQLCETLSRVGQYADAKTVLEETLPIRRKLQGADHRNVGDQLATMAVVALAERDFATAEKYAEESLRIARAHGDVNQRTVARRLWQRARVEAAQAKWKEAAVLTDEARHVVRRLVIETLPELSEREQLTFLRANDQTDLHAALSLGVLGAETYPSLAQFSAVWLANSKAVAEEVLAERAARLRAGRLKGGKEVKPSATETATAPWVPSASIRRAIPADGLLLDFLRLQVTDWRESDRTKRLGKVHYAAWLTPATDRGAVRVVDLGEAAPIEKAVQAYRTAMSEAQTGKLFAEVGEAEAEKRLRSKLQALSDLILKPLLPHLKNKEELILCPDGALNFVPWAALPIAEDKYAVEQWRLRYTVHARALVAKHAKISSAAPQVFADPNFDLPAADIPQALKGVLKESSLRSNVPPDRTRAVIARVPPLPGTAVEAEAVAASLREFAGEPIRRTQGQALEEIFKRLSSPRVLVLATHGYFLADVPAAPATDATDDDHPLITQADNPLLRCGLLLSGCNQERPADSPWENGVLTGLEITGVDLRGTELVVLSACETGIGVVQNGEGVVGLRQAFQLAGARTVVSTLWQIPDRETALLMNEFFNELAAKHSPADALCRAQRRMIEARRKLYGGAHPMIWAAWTVTGG